MDTFFDEAGNSAEIIKRKLDEGSYTFSLSDEQFAKLNENFRRKISMVNLFSEPDTASAVFRLGLITFRIAMILTVVQKDAMQMTAKLKCSDQDLEIALNLADVYYEHSQIMYSRLPKKSRITNNPKMRDFYSFLPKKETFKRNKANEIGKRIGISEKSVHNYLSKFAKEGILENTQYGSYRRTE